MTIMFMFIYDSGHHPEGLLRFTAFKDDSLPFPLNLNLYWRLLISAFWIAIFALGVRLRLKIISYIRSPDFKINETNILFCLDQVGGLFLAIALACGICFTILTVPASSLINLNVCDLNGICTGLYFGGTFIWRACIAIIRVLYIKAQKCLTGKIGEKNLLALMVAIGVVIITRFSVVAGILDKYSYSQRICHRWPDGALDVLQSYQALTETETYCLHCWFLFFSLFGLVLIATELSSYIIIFHHITVHNNDVMSGILDKNVIKKRNLTNAISVIGLFICWSIEIFHVIFAGFLAIIVGDYWNRVLSVYLRYLEFVIVPLVHIYTSAPIRKFLTSIDW